MHTNQLTCTTNMILSHYVHRLWGLQKRKVLKSILHCNWEIFISPGNSSVTPHMELNTASHFNNSKLDKVVPKNVSKFHLQISVKLLQLIFVFCLWFLFVLFSVKFCFSFSFGSIQVNLN